MHQTVGSERQSEGPPSGLGDLRSQEIAAVAVCTDAEISIGDVFAFDLLGAPQDEQTRPVNFILLRFAREKELRFVFHDGRFDGCTEGKVRSVAIFPFVQRWDEDTRCDVRGLRDFQGTA